MKEELKIAIGFIVGASVGGGLSFLITRAHCQKKYKKELVDISNLVAKLQEKEKQAELVEKEAEEEYGKVLDDFKELAKNSLEFKLKEAKEAIRAVDEKEFLELDYALRYLSWYEDGTITDNRDIPIDTPEMYLGPFYGDFFEGKTGGIVHIANDQIKEKYSIEVCMEPYNDDDISIPEVNVFPTDDDDDEDY